MREIEIEIERGRESGENARRERERESYPRIACERVIGIETEEETVNFTDFVQTNKIAILLPLLLLPEN